MRDKDIKRLNEIRNLKNGWYDGEQGTAYKLKDLEFVEQCLNKLKLDFDTYIYPFPDDEISLEWDIDNWSIVCTIDFLSQRFYFTGVSDKESFAKEFHIDGFDYILKDLLKIKNTGEYYEKNVR